jgi:hypothetical protein
VLDLFLQNKNNTLSPVCHSFISACFLLHYCTIISFSSVLFLYLQTSKNENINLAGRCLLGKKFNISKFHDGLLSSGYLLFNELEKKWVPGLKKCDFLG